MKCKRPSDARAHDHHTLQVMRQQAVKAVRHGETADSVSKAMGVNIRTVFRWLADFSVGGQSALLAKPIPGRPTKLSADEMSWIAKTVKDHTPQQFKFEFGLWTLNIIRSLIKHHLKKDFSISSVHRIMKTLGFSAQRPLYQAWQQDATLVRTWESETFPAIRAQAKKEGATIYFADESGLRSDYHKGTTWSPQGQTPVLQKTGRRFSINMISAVSPRGDFRFMLHEGSVNAKVFLDFLKRLMIGATRPVFVILDGHPIHKAAMIKTYVEQSKGMLKLFYLPPYSPHLNPDETVWAHVKRDVSRRLVENKEHMKQLALSVLRRLQKLPTLIMSFFRQPECRYILE